MLDDKVEAMTTASRFASDYWDGDRRYGYGGYTFRQGYWSGVAKELIDIYGLRDGSSVLDVGCGKAFLLHEMLVLQPGLQVRGVDISQHALDGSTDLVRGNLSQLDVREGLPFGNDEFDLVISLATIHNFALPQAAKVLTEVERVGKTSFVMVESYRNWQELFNLECWALTCKMFLSPDDWIWLFDQCKFSGDYEFIFFE